MLMQERDSASEFYTSEKYLELTHGTWHLEDSPFKAKYVARLLEKNRLQPQTICEIGCGAGGILHALAQGMAEATFTGYEISPAAHAISQRFASPRVEFIQGDAFADNARYDVALVMDVVEHVEDCFGFLRQVRTKADYKVYHFPIEITCTSAIRDLFGKAFDFGHIHHFSVSSALAALEHTGHRIIDSIYTPVAFERGRRWQTRAMNAFRRLLPAPLATKLVGGYSLMILAK